MNTSKQIVDKINKELILHSQTLLSPKIKKQVFHIGDKLNFCGKQYEITEILSNGFTIQCVGDTKFETGIEHIDNSMKDGINFKNII